MHRIKQKHSKLRRSKLNGKVPHSPQKHISVIENIHYVNVFAWLEVHFIFIPDKIRFLPETTNTIMIIHLTLSVLKRQKNAVWWGEVCCHVWSVSLRAGGARMSLITKKEGLKGQRVIHGGINEDYCTVECIKNYLRENYAVPSFQPRQFEIYVIIFKIKKCIFNLFNVWKRNFDWTNILISAEIRSLCWLL